MIGSALGVAGFVRGSVVCLVVVRSPWDRGRDRWIPCGTSVGAARLTYGLQARSRCVPADMMIDGLGRR